MTHKPTTEPFADDEFDTTDSSDESWLAEPPAAEPLPETVRAEKQQRKHSALRSIEERRERERLRQELEDFDFESDTSLNLD